MFKFLVNVAHLSEKFFNLTHAVKFVYILCFSFKEGVSLFLNEILLFRCISIVLHSAFVSERIMHSKFLFELPDFTFKFFQ